MLSISTRPVNFSQVIGQDLAVLTLKKLASTSTHPINSIVLQGSYGSGKTSLSKIYAKAVGCKSFQKTGDVCNECEHCVSVNKGTSEFYREYDSSRVGNVESVKSLIDSLSFRVPENKTRVIVLDEAHQSSTAALTALLKVIEEGIPNTVFMFCTTEPMLKTIMSRSCVIPIYTIPTELMVSHINSVAAKAEISLTAEQAYGIAFKADGHVRDAMQYLDFFDIAGERAIETPYNVISEIILKILKKQDITELIDILSTYPINIISPTVSRFLANCFLGGTPFETKLRDTGVLKGLFNFFFSSPVQTAMKDEYGVVLTFRYLQTYFI